MEKEGGKKEGEEELKRVKEGDVQSGGVRRPVAHNELTSDTTRHRTCHSTISVLATVLTRY